MLGPLFNAAQGVAPEARQRLLSDWAKSEGDDLLLTSSWAEAADKILQVFRPVVALQAKYLKAELVKHPERLVGLRELNPTIRHAPVDPFVTRALALDLPHTIRYVEEEDVDRWHEDSAAMHIKAFENLMARGLSGRSDGLNGTFLADGPPHYATSFLGIPGVFSEVGERLGGEVVAFAPNYQTLCFVRTDDPAAVQRTLNWATDTFNKSSRLALSGALRTGP